MVVVVGVAVVVGVEGIAPVLPLFTATAAVIVVSTGNRLDNNMTTR